MLSLKEQFQLVSSAQPASSICRLLGLPSELLAEIISILGHNEYRAEVLCPVSLVSRRFRHLAQALLFRSIKVVLSQRFVRRGETFIGCLICSPRIRRCVESVQVCAPLQSASGEDTVECSRFLKLLPMLSNLQSLRLYALNDETLPLLKGLASCARPVHLSIADVSVSYVLKDNHLIQFCQPELLANLECCASISIGFVHGLRFQSEVGRLEGLVSLKSVLAKSKAIKAVQVVDGSGDRFFRQETLPGYTSDLFRAQVTAWNTLEEVQINIQHFPTIESIASSKYFWVQQHIWSNLRRLSVMGPAHAFGSFFHHAASLSNLVSLKLCFTASSDRLTQVPETSNSPFSHLTKLRELELELVGSQIRIGYFTNPHLRKLKIHSAEEMFRRPLDSVVKLERTPEEIAGLLKSCPLLQEVEVDVGDLSNLWNGHAVAGIDVHVSVYNVLASLARLPRLKKLRLFPPYCKRDLNSNFPASLYHQPISDEQAIKVFNYLRSQGRSLEEVAVSTDNRFASLARRANFHAMSWTMHTLGCQTILVTRQASRDYEQRQVWIGERRLTTEIRRFSYSKPYIPDSPGWILPTSSRF